MGSKASRIWRAPDFTRRDKDILFYILWYTAKTDQKRIELCEALKCTDNDLRAYTPMMLSIIFCKRWKCPLRFDLSKQIKRGLIRVQQKALPPQEPSIYTSGRQLPSRADSAVSLSGDRRADSGVSVSGDPVREAGIKAVDNVLTRIGAASHHS